MATREEVMEKVTETLVDALGVDDDEITEEAVLVDDLGAESIDFLDIVFKLEKNFGIKIPRGELFPDTLTSDPSLVDEGVVTAAGIAALKEKMPHADVSAFESDPKVANIQGLFTVKMIANFVEAKLNS
jgi:acyl carrier protein